jgi:type I restriction enzyme S subunit
MKKGWQTKTLGDVLVKTETTDPTRSPSTEFDYIDVSSVSNETLTIQETQCLKGKDAPSRARRLVRANDVLFATIRPTLRRIAIVPDELDEQVCSTGYFVLRAKPEVDFRFVFYFLQTEDFMAAMEKLQKGASYPAVTDGDVRSQPLPVPPLAEQQRIVGVLDEAFAGLATAQAHAAQNLQNARALFESHLQSVFTQPALSKAEGRGKGWVEKTVDEVCSRLHQGLNTAGEKVKFYETGYPIIQTRNVENGVIELDTKIKFMCEEDWQRYRDKYRPEVGDVFFTNIGTIGKTAIVTEDLDYLIHWNIFKLRPRLDTITSEFLKYTLDHLTQFGFFHKMQKGGTVEFVTKKMISEASIGVPDVAEQKHIAAQLDALAGETQRLTRLYEQKQAALAALKKSLLHQAFTGEL